MSQIEVRYWQNQFRYMVYAILVMALLFLLLMYLVQHKQKDNVCYNFPDINKTLQQIEKNCGSTFLTHKWNDNNWFIFQSNVCDGTKCESKYYPLEDCLG